MASRKSVKTTTEAIGYLTQEDAIRVIERESNLSFLKVHYKGTTRSTELSKVTKVVENIKQGMQVKAQVFRYIYKGVVLGYAKKSRGWVMALLLQSGSVKEVSIDPRDWFRGDETTYVCVEKVVYVIFHKGYRLVIDPTNKGAEAPLS